jgi:hypothetical protein
MISSSDHQLSYLFLIIESKNSFCKNYFNGHDMMGAIGWGIDSRAVRVFNRIGAQALRPYNLKFPISDSSDVVVFRPLDAQTGVVHGKGSLWIVGFGLGLWVRPDDRHQQPKQESRQDDEVEGFKGWLFDEALIARRAEFFVGMVGVGGDVTGGFAE